MYKILGSDGNEYGPVSIDQLKKWIAENRVEKKTPVIPEGGPDWVFLDSLPEFAAAFTPPAPGPPPSPSSARGPKSADGLNRIIPYKNARALAAYYLGVFSVVPPFGAAARHYGPGSGDFGTALSAPESGSRRQNPRLDWNSSGRLVWFCIFGVDRLHCYQRGCP